MSTTHRKPAAERPAADGPARIIQMLQKAYMMELETVTNYLANSIHLDGVRAEEVKRSLAADVTEELGHAQRLAKRIRQLRGTIPGSLDLEFNQEQLQPPAARTDVRAVVEGVIAAENEAIEHYARLIQETDGVDFVTQDLVVGILGEEEQHRVMFEGFLAEFNEFG